MTYPLGTFHTAVYKKLNTGDCHYIIYFPVTSTIVFDLIVQVQVVSVCDSARKLKNFFSAFCCLFLTSMLFIKDKSYMIVVQLSVTFFNYFCIRTIFSLRISVHELHTTSPPVSLFLSVKLFKQSYVLRFQKGSNTGATDFVEKGYKL